jgi:hypothetical protein
MIERTTRMRMPFNVSGKGTDPVPFFDLPSTMAFFLVRLFRYG